MEGMKKTDEALRMFDSIMNVQLDESPLCCLLDTAFNVIIQEFNVFEDDNEADSISEDIGFFMYELNWGEEEHNDNVFMVDGEPFPVHSIEDFYNYLMYQYVPEEKEVEYEEDE